MMTEQDQEERAIEEPEVEAEVEAVENSTEVPEPDREEAHDQEADTSVVETASGVEADEVAVEAPDIEGHEDQEKEPSSKLSDAEEVELPEESADEDLDLEQDQEMTSSQEVQEDDDRAWYVVHCYSGYENKVHHNLMQRIESMGMQDKIFDVVVPTEEEIEVKEGKRRTVERRVFPGYILVNMTLTEESWYVVRNTPGVTGFVGMGSTPIPLRPEEVAHIVKRMEAEAPRIKVTFRTGERVRIIEGPFKDFHGTVAEIDMDRAKVRVMVNFFGRETPVELDFLQVEKM
jgi:transcriptional antiterminator NusG